jgi:hypothetical protein
MATSATYDEWDDPGLSFTEEQVAAYTPQAVAAVRVNWLLDHIPLALRRSQLGEKAEWWRKVADKMVDVVTWYCVVAELPGIDREEIFDLPGAEEDIKKLTVAARKWGSPEDILAEWRILVRSEMVQHVTLSRRCAGSRKISGWNKRERSISNRVANALFKEATTTNRLESMLNSRTKSKKDEE